MDLTHYNSPGVFIEDNTIPLVSVVGVAPSLVCLVGPAVGYETATEAVQVSEDNPVALINRGIYTGAVVGPPAIPAPVVTKTDGTVLVVDVDYSFATDTSGGGGTANSVVSISRVGTSTDIDDGDTVVISYYYTDSTYFTPQTFDDYDSFVEVYGAPMVQTTPVSPNDSQIVSPLSLAAKIAFENGATQVVAVPTNSEGGTVAFPQQLVNAYAKVANDYRITLIVPITPDSSTVDTHTTGAVGVIAADLRAHCVNSAAAGYGRVGILGLAKNYNIVSGFTTGVDTLATTINSSRVMLAYPNRVTYYNGLVNQNTEIDGFYLAAAYAGRLAAIPVNKALTRETIRSFSGFPSSVQAQQTKSFKDSLSRAGVAVSEIDRQGRIVVRHGTTTAGYNAGASVLTRELNVVRGRDTLYALLQEGMDAAGLIGIPIDIDTPLQVKGVVAGILENAVATHIVVAYQNLKVRQQPVISGDPTVIEVKFEYIPYLPLNYIVVAFSINLQTGVTDLAA